MSRNGSGVYSLPAGNPVVTGTTISSSWANTTLSDIATALTGSVAADGQTAMTGNLQMGNNKITGLAVATSSGDALSYGQAATISALTVTGAFAANGGATLGDASGDALTINSSAVSIPNGLNFDSNTFVIDATNNRVSVGTNSPVSARQFTVSNTSGNAYININGGTGTTASPAFTSLEFRGYLSNRTAVIQSYDQSGSTVLSGGLLFYTNANMAADSPTERMRIDSSGNVGIGTSSPSATAKVTARDATYGLYRAENTVGGFATFGVTANATSQGILNCTNEFVFQTGSAERMRIDSSGNLLVGTTSVFGGGGIVSGTNFVVGTSGSYWKTTNFSATYYFAYNGTDKATINGSTGAYTALSDASKKKDFEPSTLGLAAVLGLKPTLFRMIDDEDSAEKQLGFLAQDVQSVIPQAYTEQDAPDGKFIGLQDRPIIAVLTKAIQEQQAIITELKSRIESLENK